MGYTDSDISMQYVWRSAVMLLGILLGTILAGTLGKEWQVPQFPPWEQQPFNLQSILCLHLYYHRQF